MNINAQLNREYIGLLRRVRCGPTGNSCLYGTNLGLIVGPESTDSGMNIQVVASAKPGLRVDWQGLPVVVTSEQDKTSYVQTMDRSGSARFEGLLPGEYRVEGGMIGKVWTNIPPADKGNEGHVNVFDLGEEDSRQRIVLEIKTKKEYEVTAPDLRADEAILFAFANAENGCVFERKLCRRRAPAKPGGKPIPFPLGISQPENAGTIAIAADEPMPERVSLACWIDHDGSARS